jgi:hypothetical protein
MLLLYKASHDLTCESISPFLSLRECSIELIHTDAFRVHTFHVHSHIVIPSILIATDFVHCSSECLVNSRFPSESLSNDHEPEPDIHGLVELNNLLCLFFIIGQEVFFLHNLHSIYKHIILSVLKFDSWKQISNDSIEQWEIIFHEFWNVRVSNCSDKNQIFLKSWVLSLDFPSHH